MKIFAGGQKAVSDFWCLFCGKDGPHWDNAEEMMDHMKTTVHRDKAGAIIFFDPKED